LLRAGDDIYAVVEGCGIKKTSDITTVRLHGDLRAPHISECGGQISVTGVLPGARVEVYKDGYYFAGKLAGSDTVIFPLATPLEPGTALQARQILCGMSTPLDEKLIVQADVEKRALHWVPGSTQRLCQLTGDSDPQGYPKLTKTRPYDIDSTDLGIVVDHVVNGEYRTYFFFGDTIPADPDHEMNGDAIAWTTYNDPEPYGVRLNIVTNQDGLFRRLVVPGIDPMREFEVPSGGFSHGNKLYLFVTDDHFKEPPRFPWKNDEDSMGRSLLVQADDSDPAFTHPGRDFYQVYEVSNRNDEGAGGFKFINVAAWKISNSDWPGLPDSGLESPDGLILIGSGRYRESLLHLAYVPLARIEEPDKAAWQYFKGFGSPLQGTGPCGRPLWADTQAEATPLFFDNPWYGELSLTYNAQVGLWLLTYNAPPGIWLRYSMWPWGPWSQPELLFEYTRDGGSNFIQPGGGVYGPYQMHRYSRWDPWSQTLTIYYTMSTWEPYQVMLMRSSLKLECRYKGC
jgi:hypothetical protein